MFSFLGEGKIHGFWEKVTDLHKHNHARDTSFSGNNYLVKTSRNYLFCRRFSGAGHEKFARFCAPKSRSRDLSELNCLLAGSILSLTLLLVKRGRV